jgi:hypothetical protein
MSAPQTLVSIVSTTEDPDVITTDLRLMGPTSSTWLAHSPHVDGDDRSMSARA